MHTTRPRITVLLVDDHPSIRENLRLLLEQFSDIYIIGEAANGVGALNAARTLGPDVIVMDINMPDMDGIQATRLITLQQPSITIIGMPMHGGEAVKRSMLRAGARAYLLKEHAAETLYRTIQSSLPYKEADHSVTAPFK